MKIILLIAAFLYLPVAQALEPLDADALDAVHGQGGVYLTGEFTINKNGGPLWSIQNGALDDRGGVKEFRNCGTAGSPRECGMRLAFKVEEGTQDGWVVLDDVTGSFAFEGLTLRTRSVATNNGNKEVLEVGLPGQIRSNEFRYTVAFSNSGEWSPSIEQTNILTVRQNGIVNLQGNLLLFPVEVQ